MQAEPSEIQSVRESVALLVAEHGIAGAEAELQRRFHDADEQDRALTGLAILRKEYRSE